MYPTAGAIVRDVPPVPGKDWNDALRTNREQETPTHQESVRSQEKDHATKADQRR